VPIDPRRRPGSGAIDVVLLALSSAFLYGATTVAIRVAFGRGGLAESGALFTVLVALAVTLPFAAFEGGDPAQTWPFLLAGLLGPGLSQLLFTLAVREAGASRTSVVIGTAPLVSVAIALVFLDEPLEAGLIAGAILIVAGGLLLVGERQRPEHVRLLGLGLALAATVVFATRDNLIRWLAVDTDVAPGVAACATLAAGAALIAVFVLGSRAPVRAHDARTFAPAGVLFGLSYICLFEAYYRGLVTVVSPLVATESLWGVALSAVVLGRSERIGPRLVAGALLIVAGGVLIGSFR
jgi:drug/metabolite transporter (DMT)-like permease